MEDTLLFQKFKKTAFKYLTRDLLEGPSRRECHTTRSLENQVLLRHLKSESLNVKSSLPFLQLAKKYQSASKKQLKGNFFFDDEMAQQS